ncbi:MAG: hypothetical protein AAF942_15260, partial [Pseudomonadota bacterium]
PEHENDFNDWYVNDHLPERVSLPGFRRGRRWQSVGPEPRYFTFYEIDDVAVMTSERYRERLEAPTAWTRRIMPAFTAMNRSICRVTVRLGSGDGGASAVIRLKPFEDTHGALRDRVRRDVLPMVMGMRGIVGASLWELDGEASTTVETAETRLRGGADAVIDWALVFEATRPEELAPLVRVGEDLSAKSPEAASVGPLERYRLLCGLNHDAAVALVGGRDSKG